MSSSSWITSSTFLQLSSLTIVSNDSRIGRNSEMSFGIGITASLSSPVRSGKLAAQAAAL